MKTFLFSVALLLVTMLGFSNKASAQAHLVNHLACAITYDIDFGPPCGIITVTVPAGGNVTIGGGCGPILSATISDGANSYTLFPPSGMAGILCGRMSNFNVGPAHVHVMP